MSLPVESEKSGSDRSGIEGSDRDGIAGIAGIMLLVNLKTAKALDITVPQSVLARADEVIE